MHLSAPETLFARVESYLDATAVTPQGEKGEAVVRPGLPKLQIPMGQTLLFSDGQIIALPGVDLSSLPMNADGAYSPCLERMAARSAELQSPGFSPLRLCGMIRQRVSNSVVPQTPNPPSKTDAAAQHTASIHPPVAADWDAWVSTRVQQKREIMSASLKASGLTSPVPKLADMYEHGSFFPCEPYGTCWEPMPQDQEQQPAPQSTSAPASQAATQLPSPGAQSSVSSASNIGLQPQTVSWVEMSGGRCSFGRSRSVSRVANSPQQLQDLLRLKSIAEAANSRAVFDSGDCYPGYWISCQGHYARVVTPQPPPPCRKTHCKSPHPRHPVWVRAGNKVGFVPPHPKDVKGKPPLNLKNGIIIPQPNPRQPVQLVPSESSTKIRVLKEAPKEYRAASSVAAPEIRAHLLAEATRERPLSGEPLKSQISYDYKSQRFVMAGDSIKGTKSGAVALGGISSSGRVASFAGGHSYGSAQSFPHGGSAGSYGGGGHGSGSYSSGSHSSGSSSSGSSSSSSHSSGGGGGGYSSSSSSSSSSAAGSSGGGGSHPH